MSLIVSGYASVSGVLDLKNDIVQRGAFLNSITKINPEILCHLEHGPDCPQNDRWAKKNSAHDIATFQELYEDKIGLRVIMSVHPLYINRMKTLIARGIIRGFSIGFIATEWDFNSAGNRILNEVELLEISFVRLPACPGAVITNPGFKMKNKETSYHLPGINLLYA